MLAGLPSFRGFRCGSYLTKFWTDHGIRFIEQNKDRPFFLYLAYNGPYGLGAAMREPIRNRFASHYATHPLPSMPRDVPNPTSPSNLAFEYERT